MDSKPRYFMKKQPLMKPKISEEIVAENNRRTRKQRIIKSLLVVWFIIGTFSTLYVVSEFLSTYEFRNPVIRKELVLPIPEVDRVTPSILSPIPEENKVTPTNTPTSIPIKKQRFIPKVEASTSIPSFEKVVDGIFTLESSKGRNDGCRDKGLYNGYGYGQSTFAWNCFETQEEVIAKVNGWLEDKIDKGFTIAEALCYYNEGIRRNDCPYYQKFMTL